MRTTEPSSTTFFFHLRKETEVNRSFHLQSFYGNGIDYFESFFQIGSRTAKSLRTSTLTPKKNTMFGPRIRLSRLSLEETEINRSSHLQFFYGNGIDDFERSFESEVEQQRAR